MCNHSSRLVVIVDTGVEAMSQRLLNHKSRDYYSRHE